MTVSVFLDSSPSAQNDDDGDDFYFFVASPSHLFYEITTSD